MPPLNLRKLSVRLPYATKIALRRLARDSDCTISELVRELVGAEERRRAAAIIEYMSSIPALGGVGQ